MFDQNISFPRVTCIKFQMLSFRCVFGIFLKKIISRWYSCACHVLSEQELAKPRRLSRGYQALPNTAQFTILPARSLPALRCTPKCIFITEKEPSWAPLAADGDPFSGFVHEAFRFPRHAWVYISGNAGACKRQTASPSGNEKGS